MATVVKDFKVKAGLVVEGTTATVNNFDVLTKSQASQDYIVSIIGGETLITSVDSAQLEVVAGELAVIADTFDAFGSAATAESNAIDAAALDATSKANAAQAAAEATASADATSKANAALASAESYADQAELDAVSTANDYTDGRETAITTAYQSYADTAESDAIASANSYTDGRETAITTAYQTYADTAETDAVATANAYTDGEISTLGTAANDYVDLLVGDATVDGTAGNTVTDRIATAVSNLVDGAPDLLDTLNELAAAIADDENFATTIASDIATGVTTAKAYTDTRETAITTAYQTYADTAESDAVTSANGYTDGRETAITTAYQSYADTAEADAISTAAADATSKANAALASAQTYADTAEADAISTAAADATTKANTAESNANTFTTNAIDALDTDDIEEGTGNLYFTDERAQDAVAAAIAAGTHANISITYDDNANTISFEAENGVADSDTDDLTEGSSNLYFTDARAVDALEAVVPNFTEIDINSVATQIASTSTVATASQSVAYSFAKADYRSAKFLVKVAYGTHTELSEVLITLDTSDNIAITEYAIVGTNGSASTISAGINGTDVELLVTTTNDNSDVTVMGTLLV